MLADIITSIRPADQAAYAACAARWDQLAKPIGGLGELEKLICRVAAATGSARINLQRRCVLVFCADNGVVAEGVSQTGSDVTLSIARMLADGAASVCRMAHAAHADVFAYDVGMNAAVEGLACAKTRCGSANMAQSPAMTPADAVAALSAGYKAACEKATAGYKIIAVGEAGIGNTTAAAAVCSALLGISPEITAGRGAGLSDEGLRRKIEVVQKALSHNLPDAADPLDVLYKVGSLDMAAMAGAFLGGAASHVPMVVDGCISAAAALLSVRLSPAVQGYLLPSHMSAEPMAVPLMQALGLCPVLHAAMHLGEGTGAVALFPLLDLALAVYDGGTTFTKAGIPAYRRQL